MKFKHMPQYIVQPLNFPPWTNVGERIVSGVCSHGTVQAGVGTRLPAAAGSEHSYQNQDLDEKYEQNVTS